MAMKNGWPAVLLLVVWIYAMAMLQVRAIRVARFDPSNFKSMFLFHYKVSMWIAVVGVPFILISWLLQR